MIASSSPGNDTVARLAPTFVAIAAFGAIASPALAQSRGWYAGIAAGQSRTSSEVVSNQESTITLATDAHTDFDANGNAWKAFGGYRLNSLFAVEVGYADLGSHRLNTAFLGGVPPLPAAVETRRRISGFGADLVLAAPLGPRFSVFGALGAFRSHVVADIALDGNVVFTSGDSSERSRTNTRNETVTHYGVGGQWMFSPATSLRIEWERYANVGKPFEVGATGTTGRADTDLISIGLVQRF